MGNTQLALEGNCKVSDRHVAANRLLNMRATTAAGKALFANLGQGI
jgi:hypothetical protein